MLRTPALAQTFDPPLSWNDSAAKEAILAFVDVDAVWRWRGDAKHSCGNELLRVPAIFATPLNQGSTPDAWIRPA